MSEFEPASLIGRLEVFGKALPQLFTGLSEGDVRWKPDAKQWSLLEICCHLADEESDDFRSRLDATLHDPTASWPPLDLENVAERREYNRHILAETLDRFVDERMKSVLWLRSLNEPDWQSTHRHPKIGEIRAGDLLAAWVAHDALHLKQIGKRLKELADRSAGPFTTRYAEP